MSSLENGSLVPEEHYEITGDNTGGLHYGPKRARTSASQLLHGYTVALTGQSSKITESNNKSDMMYSSCQKSCVHAV